MSLLTRGAPALILPSWWRNAPIGPLEINDDNPLSRGIVFGTFGHHLIGPGVDRRTAQFARQGGISGFAHNRLSGVNGYLTASGFGARTVTRATLAWGGLLGTFNTAAENGLLSVSASNSNAAICLTLGSGGTGSIFHRRLTFAAGTANNQFELFQPQTADNTRIDAVAVYDGNLGAGDGIRGKVYRAGVALAVQSIATDVDLATSVAGLDVGSVGAIAFPGLAGDPIAATTLEGQTDYSAVWLDRALTADEVAEFNRNPFQVVRRRANRIYSLAAYAAVSGQAGLQIAGAITEEDDTVSGAITIGAVILTGATVEVEDTVSGAVAIEIRGGGDFLEPLPPFTDDAGETFAGGKLKVMAPMPILGLGETGTEAAPAYLVSSNAKAETLPTYSAITTYAIGAQVVFGSTVYESLANGNLNNNPAQRPTKWARVRPTYSAGAFDLSLSTVSVADGELDMVIRVNRRPDTLALLRLTGDQVQVDVVRGATTIYREIRDLWRVELAGTDERLPDDKAFFRLLCEPGDDVRITVRRGAGGEASVGAVTLGNSEVIGDLSTEPEVTPLDLSRVEFDEFGELQVTARGYRLTLRGEVAVDSGRVDYALAVLARYRSTPVVVIGADNLFRCLIVYGIVREFRPRPRPLPWSMFTIDVQGLVTG